MISRGSALALICLPWVAWGAAPKEKLIVLDLAPGAEVSLEMVHAMTELISAEAARPGAFEVVSTRELQTMLGLERQRQLTGCGGDSCLAEIGNALGSRYALRGTLGKLGASFQLSLQMVDTQKGETVARSVRLSRTLEGLRPSLPWAVAEATAQPLPKGPSKLPAVVLLSAGAASLLVGAAMGGLALLEDDALRREQDGALPGTLGTRESYAAAQQRLAFQKTGAWVAMGVGAALLVLGVVLFPADESGQGLSLMAGPSSLGLLGRF